jgi:hypothetical protein
MVRVPRLMHIMYVQYGVHIDTCQDDNSTVLVLVTDLIRDAMLMAGGPIPPNRR